MSEKRKLENAKLKQIISTDTFASPVPDHWINSKLH